MGTGLSFSSGWPSSAVPRPSGYVSMSQASSGKGQREPGVGRCQVALNQALLRGLVTTTAQQSGALWCLRDLGVNAVIAVHRLLLKPLVQSLVHSGT